MSGKSDSPPMFGPNANATPVDQIPPLPVDPRVAKVHKIHAEIAKAVKDGSIYRDEKRKR